MENNIDLGISRRKQEILEWGIVLVIMLLIPLLAYPVVDTGEFRQGYLLAFVGGLCLCFTFRGKVNTIRLSVTDVCIGLYLLYGLVHLVWVNPDFRELPVVLEWCGVTGVYVWTRVRVRESRGYVLVGVFLSAACQAIVGWLQYFYWLPSNHGWFPVTGCFFNPGPYGGFLAVGFVTGVVCVLQEARKDKKRWGRIACGVVMLFLVGGMLVLSDSRAAWLGTLVGMGCLFFAFVWRRGGWIIRCRFVAGVVLCVGVLCGLYFYKVDSADARLFIWQVSAGIFADSPWVGQGIGSFAAFYMDEQAVFLAGQPEYGGMADNNHLAFNELIHLGCEQGMIGMLLFVTLLVSIFYRKDKNFWVYGGTGLVTWLVFAFFSYPASVVSLKFLLPLLIGIVPGMPLREIYLQTGSGWWLRCVCVVGGILLLCMTYQSSRKEMDAYRLLDADATLTNRMERIEREVAVSEDRDYLFRAGSFLWSAREEQRAIVACERYMRYCPSSSLACRLGQMYRQTGDMERAIGLFERAHGMTPCHMQPVYELFVTYRMQGDRERTELTALKILSLDVPVCNSVVLNARKEAKDYLRALP